MKHLSSFLFIMLSFSTFSQESFYSYYVVVEKDKSIKPTSKTRKANNLLSLSFKSQDLQDFFSKRNVKNFQKAFPTAKSERLQRTYVVTIDGDLHSKKMSTFDDVKIAGLIPNEGGLLYQPNDYLESSGISNRALELVHADEAFDITQGNPDILIGILDNGFDLDHEDLENKIAMNYKCHGELQEEDELQCYESEESLSGSHGTTVAGAAAADTDNGIGVSSVGFKTKLVTVASGLYLSSLSIAIRNKAMLELAQIPGVKVINGSWYNRSTPDETGTEQELYREIWEDHGVITVMAAGNGGASYGGPTAYVYPQSYEHVIQVSSVACSFPYGTDHPTWGKIEWEDSHVNDVDNPMEYIHQHHDKVDLVAPGYAVPELLANGNGYKKGWGTSFASPMVAAACALILSVNPDLTPDEVKDILLRTTDDIYHLPLNQQFIGQLGTGRLNVYRAVMEAKCLYDNDPNPQLDLYMKDSDEDMGVEPNTVTGLVNWHSPAIWVRNQSDGKYVREHQNPEYDPIQPNYVYVRVRNRSCVTSSGNDQIKLYWSKANTSLQWPQHWDGSLFLEGVQMGGEIAAKTIPSLAPGQEAIIAFEWNVPNPELYHGINSNPWHFCLLGRIVSDDDPMTVSETINPDLRYSLENNNNVVLKNTTVVDLVVNSNYEEDGQDDDGEDGEDSGTLGRTGSGGVVAVSNTDAEEKSFSLELIINNEVEFIKKGIKTSMKMDDVLYDAWSRGGLKGKGFNHSKDDKKIIVTNNLFLEDIKLKPNSHGTVYVSFDNLATDENDKQEFIFHLVQRDAITGKVIGGETFVIRKKYATLRFQADAGSDIEVKRNQFVRLRAKKVDEDVIYNWYNSDEEHVHEGRIYSFHAKKSEEYKLEVVAKSDGYKDYDNVMINVITPHAIHYLAPNPASNKVNIGYSVVGAHKASLEFKKILFSEPIIHDIDPTKSEITIDTSNFQNGIYRVILKSDEKIVDTKTLIIF